MVLFNIFRSAIINFKQSAQFQYSDSKLKTACYVFQVKSLKLSLSYCSRYLRLLIVFVILWTLLLQRCSLLEKCPYFEFFLSVFSRIRSKQGEIPCISPYSARMWENTEQNILNTDTTERFILSISYQVIFKDCPSLAKCISCFNLNGIHDKQRYFCSEKKNLKG